MLSHNGKISSFFIAGRYVIVHICVPHLFHSSIDDPLGCVHALANANNAAINIRVCITFLISVFVFFR